jgi:hypothetical protein
MSIETEHNSENEKTKRYWHRVYEETVGDPMEWAPEERTKIEYIGEFTDQEWSDLIDKAPRNQYGERMTGAWLLQYKEDSSSGSE